MKNFFPMVLSFALAGLQVGEAFNILFHPAFQAMGFPFSQLLLDEQLTPATEQSPFLRQRASQLSQDPFDSMFNDFFKQQRQRMLGQPLPQTVPRIVDYLPDPSSKTVSDQIMSMNETTALSNSTNLGQVITSSVTHFTPSFKVQTTDQEYIIDLQVPGMSKEDININIHGSNLVVSGTRKSGWKDHSHVTTFARKFSLDQANVDPDHISASLEADVLQVHVPRKTTAPTTGRKVEIK
eukprot:Nitzschia sp. Nitz4//scaffold124_size66437//41443//42156//NITZ4_006113-RA/size66437-processed-gene-0.49-mRNA-1//-1//CDS//3329534558//6568//frame0